jgi:uncharacterized integral membrane protein (TIGR00698 family)
MAGGGIGVDFSLKGLPKMMPGLIVCMILGWAALQWDTSIHTWEKEYKAAEKILKAEKEGKSFLPYEEYKVQQKNSYEKKQVEYKALLETNKAALAKAAPYETSKDTPKIKTPEKPKKPTILKQADYDQLVVTKALPGKFSFGKLMVECQLTYVAILLLGGMLVRNTLGLPDILKAGTLAARPLIKPGIVILGAYYLWSNVLKVGVFGLIMVLVFVLGTAIMISFWGRRAKVDGGLAGLMSAGVGVCGVSAAVAVAPVVNAKPRDFFYAIGTILLFGTLGLFLFPYIGKALGMTQPVFGAWVGTAVLNTAQLVACASWYGHESLLTANIINIVRVSFIPLIVMWAIYFYVVQPAAAAGGSTEKINAFKVIREKFPIFILGFFVMVTMNEFGVFTPEQRDILGKELLKLFFAIGFAGVGLNIAFDDLKKAGGTAFVIGFAAAALKATGAAIAVIMIGEKFFAVL